jgi:hypothetical protein
VVQGSRVQRSEVHGFMRLQSSAVSHSFLADRIIPQMLNL